MHISLCLKGHYPCYAVDSSSSVNEVLKNMFHRTKQITLRSLECVKSSKRIGSGHQATRALSLSNMLISYDVSMIDRYRL